MYGQRRGGQGPSLPQLCLLPFPLPALAANRRKVPPISQAGPSVQAFRPPIHSLGYPSTSRLAAGTTHSPRDRTRIAGVTPAHPLDRPSTPAALTAGTNPSPPGGNQHGGLSKTQHRQRKWPACERDGRQWGGWVGGLRWSFAGPVLGPSRLPCRQPHANRRGKCPNTPDSHKHTKHPTCAAARPSAAWRSPEGP